MRGYFTLLAALMMLATAFGQEPAERIIRFHADIVIDTTGRVEVSEFIKVYADGVEIKRGIVHEIPVYRGDNAGKRVKVDVNILAVQCNGKEANYRKEYQKDYLVLYIGDADVLLSPGEYDYTIVYESYGHIGFFDDYDELYWNVIGAGGAWRIEQASAKITLPAHSSAIRTDFYTGATDATGKDGSVEDLGNIQVFRTSRALEIGEGFTVAVAFPRDIVRRPPPAFGRYPFGWLVFVIYCFYAIRKAGRRPHKPVAIPSFKPPRDLSPAEVCYLRARAYHGDALTATFVDMAVKQSMTISCNEKKKYAFINKKDTTRLRPVEQKMHNAIFSGNKEKVEVVQGNYSRFSSADTLLENELKKQWNIKDYFAENKMYNVVAGVIFCVVLGLYTLLSFSDGDVMMAFCLTSPLIAFSLIMFFTVGDFDVSVGVYLALVILPILLMASALVFHFDTTDDLTIHWLSALYYAAMSGGYFLFTKRMKVLTPEGAIIASEIEGFRMYMKTAEEHRLNMLAPPEHTLELFEKLLPYAFALGLSNAWYKKFDNVLSRINYNPDWYDGKEKIRTVGFHRSFAGLAKSVSNAKTDKSSASNSSGSGSWSSGSSVGGRVGGGGGGSRSRGW